MNRRSGKVSDKVWFYNIGLGGQNGKDERNWEIRTLKQIMKDLKHEHVRTALQIYQAVGVFRGGRQGVKTPPPLKITKI